MEDPTEAIRRRLMAELNALGTVLTEEQIIEVFEATHEPYWRTKDLMRDYLVHSFLAPYVLVTRKSDGVRGTLAFIPHPRVYHSFVKEGEAECL